jgi:hypothetical protein
MGELRKPPINHSQDIRFTDRESKSALQQHKSAAFQLSKPARFKQPLTASKYDGSVFSSSFPVEATAHVMQIHPEKFVGTVLPHAKLMR